MYGQSRYRIPWEGVSLVVAVGTGSAVGLVTPMLNANGLDTLPLRTALFIGVVAITALSGMIRASDVRAAWATLGLLPRPGLWS